MTKYLKDKRTGKFVGSVGVGKNRIPAATSAVPPLTTQLTSNATTPPKIDLYELSGVPVPVTSLQGLTHVGDLNLESKKGWSYEGNGLSVSLHPEVWQRIARLSGRVWEFPSKDNKFLDYHRLTDSQKDSLISWGLAKGYISRSKTFTVSWWDDEMGDELTTEFVNRGEAEEEASALEADIVEIDSYLATDSFPDPTVRPGTPGHEQVLAAVWANEVATDLDGVWWDDSLDEGRYSAPRGVLSVSKVTSWLATLTQ